MTNFRDKNFTHPYLLDVTPITTSIEEEQLRKKEEQLREAAEQQREEEEQLRKIAEAKVEE